MRYVYIAPSRTTSTFLAVGVEIAVAAFAVLITLVFGHSSWVQMHISPSVPAFRGSTASALPSFSRSEFASEGFLPHRRNTPTALPKGFRGSSTSSAASSSRSRCCRVGDRRVGGPSPLTYWLTHADGYSLRPLGVETTLSGLQRSRDPALAHRLFRGFSASASWCSAGEYFRAEGRQDRHDDVQLSAGPLFGGGLLASYGWRCTAPHECR